MSGPPSSLTITGTVLVTNNPSRTVTTPMSVPAYNLKAMQAMISSLSLPCTIREGARTFEPSGFPRSSRREADKAIPRSMRDERVVASLRLSLNLIDFVGVVDL